MQRILVLGCGGSGKTTFARKLAEKTGLPLHHLDALYWKPNWTKPPTAEFLETVSEIVKQDKWILDGSYMGSLPIRVVRSDLILYLDFPNYVCLWNILKRRIKYAAFTGRTRPGMPAECPETIYFSFVKWVWQYRKKDKPKVLEVIAAHKNADAQVVILDNYKKLEAFLAGTNFAAAEGS